MSTVSYMHIFKSMEIFSRKYLSLYPVKDIDFLEIFPIDIDFDSCSQLQKSILHATVLHPSAIKYPPNSSYVKHFIKKLIQQLENNGHEVIEELYNCFTSLLVTATSNDESAGFNNESRSIACYRTYTIRDGVQVTLKEVNSIISEGTTGLCTWQASHVLLQYILDRPHLVKGHRVLELGAGVGLLGLGVLLGANPASYTFTDNHPAVLETLRHNININAGSESFNSRVSVLPIDWEEVQDSDYPTEEADTSRRQHCDVLLAADVVFDPSLYRPLLRTIRAVLCCEHPVALQHKVSRSCTDGSHSLEEARNESTAASVNIASSDTKAVVTEGYILNDCSATRRQCAILAATVRNEEALEIFLSYVEQHDLQILQVHEQVYQLSPSQQSHVVRVFHFGIKTT